MAHLEENTSKYSNFMQELNELSVYRYHSSFHCCTEEPKKASYKKKKEMTEEQAERKREAQLWERTLPDLLEMWRGHPLLFDDKNPDHFDRDKSKAARIEMCAELLVYGMLIQFLHAILLYSLVAVIICHHCRNSD
jgi:hypothetical protein